MKPDFCRILDANFNRTKEALRVIEDIARFQLSDRSLTVPFKKLRHEISKVMLALPYAYRDLLRGRNIDDDKTKSDVFLDKKIREMKVSDVLVANFKRAQESVRVLEEVSKLINASLSLRLQEIRFELYALEKKVIRKF